MGFIRRILRARPQKYDEAFRKSIQELVGFKPTHLNLYERAFTHPSVNKKDKDGHPINYERLEFLGDAVLGAVIASYLFDKAPHHNEGYLTKMRSKIVSRKNLNQLGKNLNLLHHIIAHDKNAQFGINICGNLFEALIGAIYLDKGYTSCEQFVKKTLITSHIDIKKLESKVISYKSLLIEWAQKNKYTFRFDTYDDTCKSEVPYFGVKLFIDNKIVSKARETSKKRAEEKAAKRAYYKMKNRINTKKN